MSLFTGSLRRRTHSYAVDPPPPLHPDYDGAPTLHTGIQTHTPHLNTHLFLLLLPSNKQQPPPPPSNPSLRWNTHTALDTISADTVSLLKCSNVTVGSQSAQTVTLRRCRAPVTDPQPAEDSRNKPTQKYLSVIKIIFPEGQQRRVFSAVNRQHDLNYFSRI